MSSKRRKYTPEFKADAVQLVVVAQRPIAQVARELEINESSLGYWVKIYREQHPDPVKAPPPVEAARLAALEAEVRRLSEENAFLKKAAAFFARTQPTAGRVTRRLLLVGQARRRPRPGSDPAGGGDRGGDRQPHRLQRRQRAPPGAR